MKTLELTLKSQIKFLESYIEFLEDSKKAARKRSKKNAYSQAIEKYSEILKSLRTLKKWKDDKELPLKEILKDFVGFLTLNDEIDIEPDKINRYIEVFLQQDNQ